MRLLLAEPARSGHDAAMSAASSAGPQDAWDVELAARMRLAIGRLHRRFSRRAIAGLTPSQLSVLVTIEQNGPLRLGDLAAREVITPPTVTRLVASLQDRDLVSRETDPEDGRAALIEIAEPGRAVLDEIRRERTAYIAERIAQLDPAARAHVAPTVELLEQLIDLPGDT
jgi:DNA-binding MarR family transcriptional regulator